MNSSWWRNEREHNEKKSYEHTCVERKVEGGREEREGGIKERGKGRRKKRVRQGEQYVTVVTPLKVTEMPGHLLDGENQTDRGV